MDIIVNAVLYLLIPCFVGFYLSTQAFWPMLRRHQLYMKLQLEKCERELNEIQILRDRVAEEMKRRARVANDDR
jgi:hypothetical protein